MEYERSTIGTDGEDTCSCIVLPAMESSIRSARVHTRATLAKWRAQSVMDDAELVVSELVTNSIKATKTVPTDASYTHLYHHLEMVWLCLQLFSGELVVSVWDPQSEAPHLKEATDEDEGGRGLMLVDALSRKWGTRWSEGGGKTVWATIGLEKPPG